MRRKTPSYRQLSPRVPAPLHKAIVTLRIPADRLQIATQCIFLNEIGVTGEGRPCNSSFKRQLSTASGKIVHVCEKVVERLRRRLLDEVLHLRNCARLPRARRRAGQWRRAARCVPERAVIEIRAL